MTDAAVGALVLYKGHPALIKQAGRKLDIALANGELVSVRPKDVVVLHPGPVTSLNNLNAANGEPLVAWELMQGQTTDLATLADLIFGEFTPASAWATWLLVEDGLLFRGTPVAIEANDAATRNALHARREARAADEAAWAAFEQRLAQHEYAAQDTHYLAEVEEVALGRRERSRVLEQLGLGQTAEAAHALLLDVGYWGDGTNPYPARAGVAVTEPMQPLLSLRDEPRLDLTHMVALAIDDADSTDPDDAISFHDGWLWVHVADAAALVAPDDAADIEARARGANLYLPEGTVHMLPREATAQLGLGLNDVSPALSFGLLLNESLEVETLRIELSLIRARRLTYDNALAVLEEEPLASLAALAARLRARRLARGAVEIDLPEVQVRVGEDGIVRINPLPSLPSRDIVLEAMLVAGEAISRYAIANYIPLPFTVQDPPFEFDPDLAGPAGMFARRRSMQRSRQQSTPGHHAGLGLEVYVQVTSPLRRYLDLVVHQQLRAHLRGQPLLDDKGILQGIGASSEPAAATRFVERQSNSHWTCVYLRQHPQWRGEGVVVDERNGLCTVLIPELATETTLRLGNGTTLNKVLSLELSSVNLPQRSATFRLVH